MCALCGILCAKLAVTETLRPASLRYPCQALYRERLFMLQCVQSAPHCLADWANPVISAIWTECPVSSEHEHRQKPRGLRTCPHFSQELATKLCGESSGWAPSPGLGVSGRLTPQGSQWTVRAMQSRQIP